MRSDFLKRNRCFCPPSSARVSKSLLFFCSLLITFQGPYVCCNSSPDLSLLLWHCRHSALIKIHLVETHVGTRLEPAGDTCGFPTAPTWSAGLVFLVNKWRKLETLWRWICFWITSAKQWKAMISDRKGNRVCLCLMKTYRHNAPSAAFWCTESFKSHRWLGKTHLSEPVIAAEKTSFPTVFPPHRSTCMSRVGLQHVCPSVCVCKHLKHTCLWVAAPQHQQACLRAVREGPERTDCCPRQLPNRLRPGNVLPPIEAEFIDQPCAFQAHWVRLGLALASYSADYGSIIVRPLPNPSSWSPLWADSILLLPRRPKAAPKWSARFMHEI